MGGAFVAHLLRGLVTVPQGRIRGEISPKAVGKGIKMISESLPRSIPRTNKDNRSNKHVINIEIVLVSGQIWRRKALESARLPFHPAALF
jgi:hypothetical protein